MSNAAPLDEAAAAVKGFDFERYVREEKSFEYPAGKTIHLELIVEPWLARHLEERRLSEDQVIAPIRGSENSRVTATVMDTEQLLWWLRSLGTDVEVVKPAALRKRMAAHAKTLSGKYGS